MCKEEEMFEIVYPVVPCGHRQKIGERVAWTTFLANRPTGACLVRCPDECNWFRRHYPDVHFYPKVYTLSYVLKDLSVGASRKKSNGPQ